MNKIISRLGTSIERSIRPCSQPKFLNFKRNSSDSTKPEEMDQMKSNPYFSKYEAKLKAVYDESPEKFLHTLKEPKKVEKIGNPEDYGIVEDNKPIKSKMSYSANKQRTLDSIMKLDKVEDLDADAINAIWITFLSELRKFPGMITEDEYNTLAKRSSVFTTFLFPLAREQGFEFIIGQWAGHECHFTPLINFQAHGENAPSIMTVVYFDELLASKKVSLEMTEIDNTHLKPEETLYLIHLMKEYYINSKEDSEMYGLLKKFTQEPHKFDHMEVIEMTKKHNISIDQFKKIIDIEKATKGILERVEKKKDDKPKKEEPVVDDRYKEKDLADFS